MQSTLLYGKTGIDIDVPPYAKIITPQHIEAVADEQQAVSHALRHPIGSAPLRDRVKVTDHVVIVISDMTRPTPNHILVPAIIQELSHVPLSQFTIINGTGTHRDQTREEFIGMLGEWVVDNVKVINHHSQISEELTHVGKSEFGCDVYLNKAYVEADFRIVTGFIEPHFLAGFSGGSKGIMPGIAGMDTIMTFHNARMIGHPLATWGNLVDNPIQDMAREVNRMCPPHFLLNVALNGKKNITNVFAGELFEAHSQGCAYVKEHAMVKCDQRYDLVITTNSGYPLDQNLYQSVKGMSAAYKIVKQGGAILCAAECSDGIPNHGNYAKILQMADTPAALLKKIEDPSFQIFDQWQVQKQVVIQTWADVYVYSTLADDVVRKCMLNPVSDIRDTIAMLQNKYGKDMSIAVLPQGPLTIPYVEE